MVPLGFSATSITDSTFITGIEGRYRTVAITLSIISEEMKFGMGVATWAGVDARDSRRAAWHLSAAKTQSSTRGREEIFVMQPAEN